ncbi:MAG TPA: hypothetical protein VL084_07885, partial [Thermoanaerobaculia bacterium]|nr:hypothetical protein [Thermoanaerobaculia bacterium]
MSLRTAAASLLLALTLAVPARSAGPQRPEGVLDFLSVWLDLERKGATEDLEDFDRATNRIARAEGELTAAVQKLARMVREGTGDRQAVANAEDAVAEAEARVRGEQERRRLLSARLADRVRRISLLREEILRRREAGRSAERKRLGRGPLGGAQAARTCSVCTRQARLHPCACSWSPTCIPP